MTHLDCFSFVPQLSIDVIGRKNDEAISLQYSVYHNTSSLSSLKPDILRLPFLVVTNY